MLKKILIGLVITIVILFGVLVAIPFIFKDKLIAIAKKEVNKQINAQVDWKDFGVSIFRDFPNVSLTLEEVSVVNNEPFKGDTLAWVGEFTASADIMSLIKGEVIDINSIDIVKPIVKVKVLKDGRANYDIAKTDSTPATEPAAFNLKLKSFTVSEGHITYDDKASDLFAEIVNLNNDLSGDFSQDRFTLKTKTTIDQTTVISGAIPYLSKVKTYLDLDLDIDNTNSKYSFKDNTIKLNELVLGLNGFVSMAKADAIDLDVQFNAKETQFKNIISLIPAIYSDQFKDVKATGTLGLSGYAKGTYAGDNYPAFGVDLKVDNASFQYPGLPASVTDINIALNAKSSGGSLDNTVIDIPKFNMRLGGDPFSARVNVRTPISDPNIDASLVGKVNLANVKNYYPLEKGESLTGVLDMNVTAKGRLSAIEEKRYQDFNAAGTIGVTNLVYSTPSLPQAANVQSLKLSFTPQYVSLDNLVAKLGKSDFNATGRMDNFLNYIFADAMLKGTFSLKSNQIDLNEFMTEDSKTTTSTQTTPQGAQSNVKSTAIQVPANIDFVMDAQITKLLYTNMVLSNVTGKITVKDETVKLDYLTGGIFNGTIALNGSYSTYMTEVPKVDMKVAINNLSIQQAFKTFNTVEKVAPLAKYMQGTFSTTFDMEGNMTGDMSPDLNTLLANGRVDLKDVVLSGNKTVNSLADRFKIPQLKNIKIPAFWTVVEVVKGKIFVKPFDVTVQNIKMNMFGSHSLTNDMDYTVLMDIPSQLLGPANELVGGLLAKSPIPGLSASNLPQEMKFKVGLTGKLADPKIGINLVSGSGSTVKDMAKEQLDAAKQKLQEEADKAKKEAEAKLKAELDKQKKAAEDKAKAEIEKQKKAAQDKLKKEAEDKLKDKLKWPK